MMHLRLFLAGAILLGVSVQATLLLLAKLSLQIVRDLSLEAEEARLITFEGNAVVSFDLLEFANFGTLFAVWCAVTLDLHMVMAVKTTNLVLMFAERTGQSEAEDAQKAQED